MITIDEIQASLHSIKVSDGTNELAIDASGFLTANVNGSVMVTATALDIRALTNADVVTIEDGGGSITVDGTVAATQSGVWNIGTVASITADVNIADGGNSITVDAVNLDIRDLASGTDSVSAVQSGVWNVNTTPGGYASWKVSAASATSTESELVATPLASRLSVLVQNLGSVDVYLKEVTGVSTVNGMKLPKGSSFNANLDDGANLFAITAAGTADLRIVEYAA